jgi:hypothetical protein
MGKRGDPKIASFCNKTSAVFACTEKDKKRVKKRAFLTLGARLQAFDDQCNPESEGNPIKRKDLSYR